jgi:hypothetical protein
MYPINKGLIHGTSKDSGTDFFTSHLEPKNTPCVFRAQIIVSKATKFYAAILHDGADEKKAVFNGDQDLIANTIYVFDLLVNQGDTVNYEVDDASTDVWCRVHEIPTGSATLVDPV